MRRTVRTRSKGLDEFDFLDESRGVGVVFQPIVELSSGDVVGYEALARTPDGSSIAAPEALLAEAYRRGRVGELNWVCRAAVFRAALDKPVLVQLPPRLHRPEHRQLLAAEESCVRRGRALDRLAGLHDRRAATRDRLL
jgi:EAL domain-containing protein (putative c-di-GMP-specific phosphodiesterase class I)